MIRMTMDECEGEPCLNCLSNVHKRKRLNKEEDVSIASHKEKGHRKKNKLQHTSTSWTFGFA